MGDESPKPAITPTEAVFLSYASQDAEAAKRICTALRAAGIEVWFDQSELRGGDAWDRKIREQIHDCRLFIPVISANSERRDEGYFRREWSLAADRTRDMAHKRAFLLPVVIDGTPERGSSVPEKFHELQWTRLPGGETPPAFVERIRKLLSPAEPDEPRKAAPPSSLGSRAPPPASRLWPWKAVLPVAVVALVLVALGYFALNLSGHSKPTVQGANSIAVLPLTNESGDPSQQYFSDGLSEDLITALSQFPALKVIGRTSSFQFRDSKEDSKTIGTKLGVAHLLEGSVRHAGDVVRVSAELVNTSDGTTQWSERYDRPYKDLFALQDDLTRAVAGALKTRLILGERASSQSDRPPSGNLEAYNAVLEGKYYIARFTEADVRKAIERFTLATQLDPKYALAWSFVSTAWIGLGDAFLDVEPAKEAMEKGRAAAKTALALAPDFAGGHIAQGRVLEIANFDWRGAETEFRRALELDPSDGSAKVYLAEVLAALGQVGTAIDLTKQALATDPLCADCYSSIAMFFLGANRLDEAEQSIRRAIALQPGAQVYHQFLTFIEVQRGNAPAALAAAQQEPPGLYQDAALALAWQIGNDRVAADTTLKNLIERDATSMPYSVAQAYAVRNDADKTFLWLDRALRERDPGIKHLLYDPFLARYKNDPRFAAFCRKVGLPTPAEVKGQT
jgi:TolB-like protein/Flp pilus assembly protein TadD